MQRREFVSLGGLAPLAAATPAKTVETDASVHLTSDGLSLTPREYARLLARLTEEKEIVPDSYSRDGAVADLETRMAAILGKESAVFLPTGTLANHLGVRLLAKGRRVLMQQESHLYCDSGDCAQRLSALHVIPLAAGKAALPLSEIQEQIELGEHGRVELPVGAISIESPVRRKNGEVVPFADMQRIAAFARPRGIGLHLDGARLFLAAPYTGIEPRQYAALFDTVYVSVFKYFNAQFGAILAGPRSLLENLYHTRRTFGGSVPHAWAEAVVAMHFLDGFEARFAKAVAASEQLLAKLGAHPGFTVERVQPGSNVALLTLPSADPQAFQGHLRASGIHIAPPRPSKTPGRIELTITTNETMVRRAPEEVAQAFFRAV